MTDKITQILIDVVNTSSCMWYASILLILPIYIYIYIYIFVVLYIVN